MRVFLSYSGPEGLRLAVALKRGLENNEVAAYRAVQKYGVALNLGIPDDVPVPLLHSDKFV